MSRRRVWMLLGLVAVLLLAALGDALAFGGLPLSSDVTEATWTLEVYSSAGTTVPMPTGANVFVVFHRLGHDFSGSDGCNLSFGTFSLLWPGRLSLSNLGQTAIGCAGARFGREDEQALAIAREVGDQAGEGTTLGLLGMLTADRGQLVEAARYFEQALGIYEATGDGDNAEMMREALESLTAQRPRRRWWPFGPRGK